MGTHAVIGFRTHRSGAAASGGSWEAAKPASMALANDELGRVARSTDLAPASTQMDITLAVPSTVRQLGLINHNGAQPALARVTLWTAAKASQLHQTAWLLLWREVYNLFSLRAEDPRFATGQYSAAERARVIPTRMILLDRWVHDVEVVTIEIDDQTNPAGYFQLGAVDIAEGVIWDVNFGWGTQYGFRFRSRVVEAEGGARYFERRAKPKVFRGAVEIASRDEALMVHYELARQHDLDRPFMLMQAPDDTLHSLRTEFWARLVDPGLHAYAHPGRDRVPFHYEEVL